MWILRAKLRKEIAANEIHYSRTSQFGMWIYDYYTKCLICSSKIPVLCSTVRIGRLQETRKLTFSFLSVLSCHRGGSLFDPYLWCHWSVVGPPLLHMDLFNSFFTRDPIHMDVLDPTPIILTRTISSPYIQVRGGPLTKRLYVFQ